LKTLLFAITLLSSHAAYAYEYKLQFNPASGARGLVVAGYYFNNNTVVGNCSYYTVTSSGGARRAHDHDPPQQYLRLGHLRESAQFDAGLRSHGSPRAFHFWNRNDLFDKRVEQHRR
jgi:hypothetical protein